MTAIKVSLATRETISDMTYLSKLPMNTNHDENRGLGFGRHIEHDERSRNFDVIDSWKTKLDAWRMGRVANIGNAVIWNRYSPILDQGGLGSCTGNAMTGLLGTAPFSTSINAAARFDEDFAVGLYELATELDSFPGTYPPTDTGSSGIGVAKAARRMRLISSYRHAFTTNALIYALHAGPVIVGVPWYNNFYTPVGPDSEIQISGPIVGGHEFVVRGYDPVSRLFLADNSWGRSWGTGGSFHFSTATWDLLRKQRSDVTVPLP